MQPSRLSLLLTATLLLAPAFAAQAQRVVEGDLQQQMSTAEFKAAGLDKLSPDELAALNAWLQQNVQQGNATAAPAAASRIGFDQDPTDGSGMVRSRLLGEFRGWEGKTVFPLENGQVWQQVGNDKWAGVKLENPTVLIEPAAFGSWRLKVEGYNTTTKVKRVR